MKPGRYEPPRGVVDPAAQAGGAAAGVPVPRPRRVPSAIGWAAAGALALLASCRVVAVQPLDAAGAKADTLTLRVGESADRDGIRFRFQGILSDNRCPVDVVCVTGGNAAAEIRVDPVTAERGLPTRLILNTSMDPREGRAWGFRVRLLDVSPAPVSTTPIPPDAYVVTLAVARVTTGIR